ncbi:MAG: AMP-binding protein [Chloroflexota bacterium]
MELNELITHYYEKAPAFKARLEEAGLTPADIQSREDLVKIPIMRKDDLIAKQAENPPFGGLLACEMSDLQAVYQSPGPIHEPAPYGEDIGNWGVALKGAGFQSGEVSLVALGYHMTPAGASIHSGINSTGGVVIPGGIGNMEQQLQVMVAFNCTGYAGLGSYLNALLDKAAELGYELKLNKAFLLAEPLPPALRAKLEGMGISVFQAYGTAECGNLGYDTPEMNGWHVPDNVILDICDITTGEPLPDGETGEVVVTLFNPNYAATVRFGVGDLSAIIPDSRTDGGPLRIAGWQGRLAGSATKVRGMFLHPVQLTNFMKRFESEIEGFQAVVTRENHRDNLAIEVVPSAGAQDGLADRVQAAARENIKFKLAVSEVGELQSDSPIRDERDWDE